MTVVKKIVIIIIIFSSSFLITSIWVEFAFLHEIAIRLVKMIGIDLYFYFAYYSGFSFFWPLLYFFIIYF